MGTCVEILDKNVISVKIGVFHVKIGIKFYSNWLLHENRK
jgi:hypothetical protein